MFHYFIQCSCLSIRTICENTYKIIKYYIGSVIYDAWINHKQENINALKLSSNVWPAENGQYDSQGFCAKYYTYSVMDVHSSKMIDFELVLKGMFVGDLDRISCELLLEKLIENYVTIQLFLSERHKGIRYFMRIKHHEISHEFDVWHLSKA